LQQKDLARWQRNMVDMALRGSCQIFHESMEKATYNKQFPPTAEVIAMIEEHEVDFMPGADEDPVDIELDPNEEVTGIELYPASLAVHEVAIEEKQPIPDLKQHLDGHKNPEKLVALQRDLDGLQELKRATRAHEYFTAMDFTGEYMSTTVMHRSLSVERLDTLGAYRVELAHVKAILCIRGNRGNKIFVSERTSMDDLRKIIPAHFQGRFRVKSDVFPLRCGTELICP
jgi:hypothetical protein